MIITCDDCKRELSHEAGDKWHWVKTIDYAFEEGNICLCGCCDPEGQQDYDERAARGKALQAKILSRARALGWLDEGPRL